MEKKTHPLKKAINVVFGIIVIAIISVAIFLIFFSPTKSFFGMTFGKVQSGSMIASGYNIGDAVIIQKQEDYGMGDVLAYYNAPGSFNKPFENLDISAASIVIHEVVGTKLIDGEKYYLTKGSSNAVDDGFWIPTAFVIGDTSLLTEGANSFLDFFFSSTGMISLIVIPCCITIALLLFDMIKLLFKLKPLETGNTENDNKSLDGRRRKELAYANGRKKAQHSIKYADSSLNVLNMPDIEPESEIVEAISSRESSKKAKTPTTIIDIEVD